MIPAGHVQPRGFGFSFRPGSADDPLLATMIRVWAHSLVDKDGLASMMRSGMGPTKIPQYDGSEPCTWPILDDETAAARLRASLDAAGTDMASPMVCAMGCAYEQGRGVPRDFVEAGRWYQKAADAGDHARDKSQLEFASLSKIINLQFLTK